LPQKLKAKSNS